MAWIKLRPSTERELDLVCLMQGYLGCLILTMFGMFSMKYGWSVGL